MMIRGALSALRGAMREIPCQTASSSLLLEEPVSSHPEPEVRADYRRRRITQIVRSRTKRMTECVHPKRI